MEIDELKQAWQTLGRQLERQEATQFALLRDRKLDKVRRSLRPLFWGQIVQIFFGVLFIALATLLWRSSPSFVSVIVAGVLVHAYGIATVAAAGITLGRIRAIDYSRPVLEIARQMASLRRTYLINGMVAGLPWWFLWVLVLMVLAGLSGADLAARQPLFVGISLAIGVAGLLATWWFHRWSRLPQRAAFGKRLEDSAAGGSIRRGQQLLDELSAFETD